MTVHVHPLPLDAVALADTWFATLGASFRGRLPLGDPLVPDGAAAWVVLTLGRELVVVDAAFPYSAPKVHLRGERRAMPHVERRGRLCLRNPAVPSDPQAAVASALREARSLLRAITAGSEDGDFEEDFGLYWGHAADGGYRARLLLRDVDGSRPIAWTAAGPTVYGFDTPGALRRWWLHRFGTDRAKVRQGALVILDELPHPNLYPSTGSELWDLVASRSTGGTAVLEDLLGQTPKGLLVVLACTAPSGRRHAVGLMLARPPDAGGRPANRRLIERGYARCSTPAEVHCTHCGLGTASIPSLRAI
ncbi:E2/UBC family protein [Methylorubrum aminovorans]